MNSETDKFEYFECQCGSSEHILRFNYDKENNEITTEIQLIQYHNIFKRIWIAIKYIIGYKCKYGSWDCWMMKNEDCERLKKLLDKVRDKNNGVGIS
jgi:hypothetical protein